MTDKYSLEQIAVAFEKVVGDSYRPGHAWDLVKQELSNPAPVWIPQEGEVCWVQFGTDGMWHSAKMQNIKTGHQYHACRPLTSDEIPALKVAIMALSYIKEMETWTDKSPKNYAEEAYNKIKELIND